MKASAALALAAIIGSGAAAAQAQEVKALAPGAQPAAATLADLKGLVGEWVGEGGSAGFSAPQGGEMVGHLLLLAGGEIRVQEMWVLRPDGDSVLARQKHYAPDLSPREDNPTWAVRKLIGVDPGHIYLENLTWETRGDLLNLYVRIGGQNGAAPMLLSYQFHRAK